jgi:hypothetical protein
MASGADSENIVFGEVPVQASIKAAAQATPAELIAMARKIWKQVARSGIAPGDDAGNDKLLEKIQAENKDFNTSFPIVIRWMVQMRRFSSAAFEKYLMKHATAKLDTRRSFLELQAEYLVYVWREDHRNPDEKVVRRYRDSIVEQLLEEDKAFLELQKQVSEEVANQAEKIGQARRAQLLEFLLAQKVAQEAAPQ